MKALTTAPMLILFAALAYSQSRQVSAEGFNELGWQYIGRGHLLDMPLRPIPEEYEKALNAFRDAINLKRDYLDAYMGLVIGLNRLGQYQEALAAIEFALHIEPNLAGAYNSLGMAQYGLKRNEEAVKSLEEEINGNNEYLIGLRQRPKEGHIRMSSNFINHLRLGHIHLELGQFRQAREQYSLAASIKPNDYITHYSLCLAYSNLGEKRAALNEFDLFTKLCNSESCGGLKDELVKALEK